MVLNLCSILMFTGVVSILSNPIFWMTIMAVLLVMASAQAKDVRLVCLSVASSVCCMTALMLSLMNVFSLLFRVPVFRVIIAIVGGLLFAYVLYNLLTKDTKAYGAVVRVSPKAESFEAEASRYLAIAGVIVGTCVMMLMYGLASLLFTASPWLMRPFIIWA